MNQHLIRKIALPLIRQLFKQPKYWVFIAVFVALWFLYNATFAVRPAMAQTGYMGTPQILSGVANQGGVHVLQNEGYVVGYSESLANPIWVTYYVGKQRFKIGKRPKFMADRRSSSGVEHKHYTRSGYTRGHMAPNYVIGSRYGQKAQKETFLMTNISPQKSRLNQKSWQRLEELVANDFSDWHSGFWVITGPIFDKNPETLKGTNIAIPRAFYKILIKPNEDLNSIKTLAFIFSQTAPINASLMQFLTTIDEVESQTGIDFLSALTDEVETTLEASKTPNKWRLPEVANRPSRY